jgi:hypothetical protein
MAAESGLKAAEPDELLQAIENRISSLRIETPDLGWKSILSTLRAEGYTVSENRVKKILQVKDRRP